MKYIFTLLIILIGFNQLNATESSPSPIIYIYDASGSMWGQINGQSKMEIASTVLTKSISELAEDQKVGLVAYGHRSEGDCKDVEYIIDEDSTDKSAAIKSLKNIKPLGKTPLAYSASLVIDKLRSTHKKATILLVTDGIESCDGNICDVVKSAKEEGIDFKMHIIGFGLKKSETEQLQCAATAGDGQYFDAVDAISLGELLDQATEQSIDKQQGNYWVKAIKNGKPVDAYVRAFQAGTDKVVEVKRSYDRFAKLYLPAGNYDLIVQPLENSRVESIKVENIESMDDKIIEKIVSFDAGIMQINSTNNSQGWDTSVTVYQHGTTNVVTGNRTYGKDIKIEVNPGFYDVKLQALAMKGVSTEHIIKNVEVKAGENTELSHNFQTGTLLVSTDNNLEGWDSSVTVYANNSKNAITGKRTYAHEVKIDINPGVYDIKILALVMNGSETTKWIRGFEVKPNQENAVKHVFESGIAKIGAKSSEGLVDALVDIKDSATNESIATGRTYAHSKNNPKEFILNPGTYKVLVKPHGKVYQPKESILQVIQGETIELMVEF